MAIFVEFRNSSGCDLGATAFVDMAVAGQHIAREILPILEAGDTIRTWEDWAEGIDGE